MWFSRLSVVRAWALAGLLGWVALPAVWAKCPAGHAAVPWQSVATGVWVWVPPAVAEVSGANAGFVAPVTVLTDHGKALVMDPGPNHLHGLRVRESVRCQLGARVVAVVNSHAHAENVLANSAFADVPDIHATPATAVAMAARCPQCLQSLTHRVGSAAMAGTHIVLPTRLLQAGDELRFGRHRLVVMPIEQGHTEGDLVLWMPSARILWVGGLAYQGRVPELAQGSLERWLWALDRLLALQPRVVVSTVLSSGREPGGPMAALVHTQHYLSALRQRVWSAMDAGGSPHDTAALELPQWRDWVGHDPQHGFNAQRAWRELEPAWMERAPAPTAVPAR